MEGSAGKYHVAQKLFILKEDVAICPAVEFLSPIVQNPEQMMHGFCRFNLHG
jgi:hypothetical protein